MCEAYKNITKVLVIGDPHFKVDNVPESDEMTSKLVKLAKEIIPKFIVVLGDVLHRHEKIHVSPLMRAERMIRFLSEIAPTFVLVGNHDRPNNSTYLTDEHPFNAMKLWPNTYIVDEKVLELKVGDCRFLFLPYVYPGLFQSTLDHPEKGCPEWKNGVSAIFCHQEFYGAQMGVIKSQAGDKWPLDYPLIISGHIHDYDRPQPNIVYVGTPLQHSFGDSSGKCVSIFTFDNGCPATREQEDRVDLGLIKKIIVYLTPEEIHTYEPPTNKLVKIVIRGDDAALKSISKLEKIKQLKKMGIKIAYKTTPHQNQPEKRKGLILKLTYKDRLYTEVCTEKAELDMFNKLFRVNL